MKLKCYKKIAALGLVVALLTGLTGCGTSLNGAVPKEGKSAQSTEATAQMVTNQAATEQVGTDKYLDMAGATEEDYSKYEKSSTEKKAQSSADSKSNAEDAKGSDNATNTGDTTDTTNGLTVDATMGGTGDNKAGNAVSNGANADSAKDSKSEYTCTLIVTCATILDNRKDFASAKESLLPSDGIIYSNQKVTFSKGETVFDVLQREMKAKRIQMEFTSAPAYNCDYVEAIDNIYEFDCGQNSGWKYSVNGDYPNYGCSQYQLKDQDVIKWAYTCNLGKDLEKK